MDTNQPTPITPKSDSFNMATPFEELTQDQKQIAGLTEGEEALKETIEEIEQPEMDFLARKVSGEFTLAKGARLIQEQAWIRAHLNYKGKYPGDMDFGTSTSRAFVQVTRPRVQTGVAMILPIIMPPGDSSWTLDPSPRPSMPELVKDLIAKNLTKEEIFAAILEAADKAAKLMSRRVNDGFMETGWPYKLARTLLDLCLYGTSVLMGPLAAKTAKKGSARENDPDMEHLEAMGFEDEYRPELDVISPFDFYPDPGARTVEECTYAIVRKVMNRTSLRDLRRLEGFNSKAIDDALAFSPDGNWTPEYWESTINISNDQQQMTAPNGRFVCLVRWGWLSGRDLQQAGINVPEEQLEEQVMAQVWCVGSRVISVRVSELYSDRLPFYVTPFSVVPHVIWGSGIAEHMFDTQDAINATERGKMDNMALVVRPQGYVNIDRLAPGQNVLEQRAGKMWAVRNSEVDSSDPVKWQVPVNALNEIRAIQADSMQLAQEQTAMPNLLMGMGGDGIHNRTSSGASMQFNAAITPLKAAIFNIENFMIIPLVQKMVDFYLTYSEDDEIRGDYRVVAQGVSGLMRREAIFTKMSVILQALGTIPNMDKRIDWERVGEILTRDSGMDNLNIMLPDAVVMANEQKAMEQQAQMQNGQIQAQAQADKVRAETSPRDALLEALKAAPDGSQLKTALIHQVLDVFGLMTQDVETALNAEAQLAHIINQNKAHAMGTEMRKRSEEYGPESGTGTRTTANAKTPARESGLSSVGSTLGTPSGALQR